MEGKTKIGEVENYLSNISVVLFTPTEDLEKGNTISIEGATTNFKQEVNSMQKEHEDIEKADAGDNVGIKVKEKARKGDEIYKVTEKD